MKKAALISVSDKTDLIPFAQKLVSLGFILLATSGSRKYLEENKVPVESIESYTAQKEILDGRVKTLHPKIHAGLLARRDNPEHMKQLEEDGIYPIEVAIINLYPFTQNLFSDAAKDPSRMIELVDIGGPTMIRASSKNFSGVLPVVDPKDYTEIAQNLEKYKEVSKTPLEFRRKLAVKVFTFTANYDLHIAQYFSNVSFEGVEKQSEGKVDSSTGYQLGPVSGAVLVKEQGLRYGENPHQQASFYRSADEAGKEPLFEQLQGKELSYNNLLDYDAALRMAQSFPSNKTAAVIIKHLNPCGAATSPSVSEAILNAKKCDPRSHFGGVIAVNQTMTAEAAENIAGDFAEIVIAPDYDRGALEILSSSKNLRVLRCSMKPVGTYELRSIQAGYLIQGLDRNVSDVHEAESASQRKPTDNEYKDLEFAWTMCSHVKSNAIVLVKDGLLVAVGAGQMSRVDSAELAVSKAKAHGHDLQGAVAASDAFFPFPDSVEFLAKSGVTAIIAPSGAKRDADVVEVCKKLGIALLFAKDRHFRH